MSDTNENQAGEGQTTEASKEKTPGIGDLAKQLIREGKTNKEVLEGIKAAFPDAKTSMSSVNWYRNNLRSLGEDVKTAREISAAGKADEKAAKAAEREAAKAAKKAEREAKKAEAKAAKEAAKAKTDDTASKATGGDASAETAAMLS